MFLVGGAGGYMGDDYDSYGGNGNSYGESAHGGYGGSDSGYSAYGSRGGAGGRGRGMAGMRGGRGGRGGGVPSLMDSQYDSTTGHSVHMRGLPYQATESDIIQVCVNNDCYSRLLNLTSCRFMFSIFAIASN